MDTLNSSRQQAKRRRRRIEELENRFKVDLVSKMVFPLVALVVAGIGAFTSWNALQLSKAAFDLNVEPLLNTILSINYYNDENVSLLLLNEGVNPIYDVHIKKGSTDYSFNEHRFPTFGYHSRDWHFVEQIPVRDSVVFEFPKPEIDLIRHNAGATAHLAKQPRGSIISVVAFEVRFRRMPDKKSYHTRKYLYVLANQMFSQDDPFSDSFLNIESRLDSLFDKVFKY